VSKDSDGSLGCLLVVAFLVIPLGAWTTHLIVCFKTASWGFLIAGAIFFPVGVVHGIGIWLGVW